uniref:BTB/POZ domain-containing protein KCTD4-like n=1 Tax=Saccoglossus kowalevskii TaxID=10224 RepID=A0ABM0MGY1_SACKO|nr:PREDICTED: BTB/POZ domain-containing protein KCTD4-like [Saccoglossus kowalevskii]
MAGHEHTSSSIHEIINLNVGGKLYSTTRSTLTRYPDTMLGAMFSGRMPSLKDAHGNYFIDRNGDMFKYILEFLRNGSIHLPEDFKDFGALAVEADFYQIAEISEYLDKKSKSADEDILEIEYHRNEFQCGWIIYSSDDVLKSLTSIGCFYDESNQRLVKLGHRRSEIKKKYEEEGLYCDLKHSERALFLNRVALFKDLSRVGFRLLSSTSYASAGTAVNRWTFSR